jgi:hypothetical protein
VSSCFFLLESLSRLVLLGASCEDVPGKQKYAEA